jgi:tetratricopeptide (TPR) repeat protein
MAFVAALVIGLMALAIAPGYAFYFDVTPKAAVLAAGTAGMLILAVRRRESPGGPRLFAVLLLANAVSLAVSTAWSTNRALSLYGGSWRCFGTLMQCAAMLFAWLVGWQSVGRPDRARAVLRGIAICGVAAAALGVSSPPGTLGDAGQLAMWLAMAVFLSMALARMETGRIWRVAARSAAALSLAGLVVIGARTGPPAGAHRQLWRDTLSMAAKRPLAGYGPEVFLARFPYFESKSLAKAHPDIIYESPRNAFLDALAAQGVPGLLLWCGLCSAGLAAAWKRNDGWLAAALAAGIVGLQFSPLVLPTAVLFLSAVGLAAGLAEKPGAPRSNLVFAAVAPFLVLALLYFGLRLAMADRELLLTKRLLDARDLPAATAEYEAYWFWRLPGASADVWYSRRWMDVARSARDPEVRTQALDISGQAAARAIGNAEEPFFAWFNLAQVATLEGNFEEAERNLRRAIAAHPNWYLPHRVLAQELLRQSRPEEAQRETALAAELEGRTSPL